MYFLNFIKYNLLFIQVVQSQRVAQYISDSESDNDMELESFNNTEEVKKRKRGRPSESKEDLLIPEIEPVRLEKTRTESISD